MSCEGIPFSSVKSRRNQSSFSCAHSSISNEGVRAYQHCIHRNHKQSDQIMRYLARLPRVGDRYKYVRQTQCVSCLHGFTQKDRKLHKSARCEQSPVT